VGKQYIQFLLIMLLPSMLGAVTLEGTDEVDNQTGLTKIKPQIIAKIAANERVVFSKDVIQQYISNTLILDDRRAMSEFPYVVGFERQSNLLGSAGDCFYASADLPQDVQDFSFVRTVGDVLDPEFKKPIGVAVNVIGFASVKARQNLPLLCISSVQGNIDIGERIIPSVKANLPAEIVGKSPQLDLAGSIIFLQSGSFLLGKHDVAVINLGTQQGLKFGDILEVLGDGLLVGDPHNTKIKHQLPDKITGRVLVYKVYDNVSLVLVIKAKREMQVYNRVVSLAQARKMPGVRID